MSKSVEFVRGYLACLYNYAIWKDGVMRVGVMERSYSEVREEILRDNGLTEEDLQNNWKKELV